MEICEGGTLFDLLLRYNEKRLNEGQVLLVMKVTYRNNVVNNIGNQVLTFLATSCSTQGH